MELFFFNLFHIIIFTSPVHLKEMSVSVERLSLAAIKQALGPGLNVRDQQQTRNLPRRRRSKPVRVISSDEEDESENEKLEIDSVLSGLFFYGCVCGCCSVVPEDMAVQPRRASLHRYFTSITHNFVLIKLKEKRDKLVFY